MIEPIDLDQLNPGIRQTVKWLRENGFETSSSGDGKTHECVCDSEYPYVTMLVPPAKLIEEADRLFALVATRGIEFVGIDENGVGIGLHALYFPGNAPEQQHLSGLLLLEGADDAALGFVEECP